MTVTLAVNGRDVQVPENSSVLDAVNASGAYVSQLCKDPDMKPLGACRTCLVQIDGTRGFTASCSLPAVEGAKVWADTAEVVDCNLLVCLFIKPVGQGRCSWFIDDAEDVEPCNFACILGGLPLRIIEICRYRDHHLGDRFTQAHLCVGFELGKNHC